MLFLANWVEFCMWWGCMCSSYWKIGPFEGVMGQDQDDWWESMVLFGPWFYCAKKYTYEPYSVWEDPTNIPPYVDRFTSKTTCWPTLGMNISRQF